MTTDPRISAILSRYEAGEAVSAEEKATLHTWLRNSLHAEFYRVHRAHRIPTFTQKRRAANRSLLGAMIILILFVLLIWTLMFN